MEQRFMTAVQEQLSTLYRTALRLTRHPQDAEDLVQEACLKAYQAFPHLRQPAAFRGWILKILVHCFVDSQRHRSPGQSDSPDPHVEGGDLTLAAGQSGVAEAMPPGVTASHPETELLQAELRQQLKMALDNLPATYRLPVFLAYVEGLSYEEIGRILGCPGGTVMSRIFRGRRLLRQALEQYWPRDRAPQEAGGGQPIDLASYRPRYRQGGKQGRPLGSEKGGE